MKRMLWFILLSGLALRLAYGLMLDPAAPYDAARGSDMRFYLDHGYALVSGQPVPGVEISLLGQPPVYFVILGVARVIFTPEGAVIATRVLQALMSTATAYFAYRMARRVWQSERAGGIAAALVALNPIFVVESGQILTETTYLFFVGAALMVYVEVHSPTPALSGARESGRGALIPPSARLALAGALFGLATLTRAVLLLFPVGIALHLLIVEWRSALPTGVWRKIAALLIAYALVVSTWTVYNLVRWNRFVIAGEGLPAFLYVGAAGWDDPQAVDQQLNETLGEEASDDVGDRQHDYLEAAGSQIGGDIGGYLTRRVQELAGAYLQPHGTTLFAGESLRELAAAWWRADRTLAGLGRVIGGEQFLPKLLLYIVHYATLILGAVGAWRARRQWRLTLPLLGFIAYVTLVHFFLLALPRYIFPSMLCWIVLASGFANLRQSRKLRVES